MRTRVTEWGGLRSMKSGVWEGVKSLSEHIRDMALLSGDERGSAKPGSGSS